MPRLVTVANRTPSEAPAAGGLAVALKDILGEREGFWFGWSGETAANPSGDARFRQVGGLSVGSIDLTKEEHAAYYAGFSNSVLWPAFHLRLDLATFDARWYPGYRRVNTRLAAALAQHLRPDDVVWVHDYHLIPLAAELRALGIGNRIGFYLHIPFPTPDTFHSIPHHGELLEDFSRYDLIGFQAQRDVDAFLDIAGHQTPPSLPGAETHRADFSRTEIRSIPIGSDPDAFAALARSPAATKMANRVRAAIGDSKLILGVDRLDYSKGLPHRVEAYEKLLASEANLRRKVHLMQVAPPSRDSIKEYQEVSDALDAACGRVMGKFSEPDWQPLTYVKRPYGQSSLAGLYRLSRIGLVTPLRDGMNLVAHEWIASQNPEDPGALVLSRFAGAAEIFDAALQVNPFDTDETATAMKIAVEMPLDERKERWNALLAAARTHSVHTWSRTFLEALADPAAARQPAPTNARSSEAVSAIERDFLMIASGLGGISETPAAGRDEAA